MSPTRVPAIYWDVVDQLGDGDLLLWRVGPSIISRVIGIAGRSEYCHAALFGRWGGTAMVLESRELRGGRAVTLAGEVAKSRGMIDVYRVSPEFEARFNRVGAMEAMRQKTGHPYGYWPLLAAACLHLPLVRCWTKPSVDDREAIVPRMPEFCSAAVASAARIGGGVDPVPNLSDRVTEPGDLARSSLWTYFCTLR